MEKLIITVAPTGSLPTKKMTPYVPITAQEIVETGQRCEAAGAALLHIHARNPVDESASTEFDIFDKIYRNLRKHTNLILQISTGGRAGMTYEGRSERLKIRPEMASLTTGSVNFPDSVYANSPQLIDALARDMRNYSIKPEIEVFDASMISNAVALLEKGIIDPPLHFDFVLGLKGALPATIDNLLYLKNLIPAGSTWSVAAIGRAQLPMNIHAILMGGHVRVGLEDNIYFSKGKLTTNERLVERVVRLSREFGREVATSDEARSILGLKKEVKQ